MVVKLRGLWVKSVYGIVGCFSLSIGNAEAMMLHGNTDSCTPKGIQKGTQKPKMVFQRGVMAKKR